MEDIRDIPENFVTYMTFIILVTQRDIRSDILVNFVPFLLSASFTFLLLSIFS